MSQTVSKKLIDTLDDYPLFEKNSNELLDVLQKGSLAQDNFELPLPEIQETFIPQSSDQEVLNKESNLSDDPLKLEDFFKNSEAISELEGVSDEFFDKLESSSLPEKSYITSSDKAKFTNKSDHLAHHQKNEEKPLDRIENLVFCGGGGRGLAYMPALKEARQHGLELKNIRHTAGTSAGAIAALLCAVSNDVDAIEHTLYSMPAEKLKDYSFSNLFFLNSAKGLCHGKQMRQWLKKVIYEHTGLENPTFLEFYHKTGKDLHAFAANITKGTLVDFCVNKTPHARVADAVQISTAIPLAYKPVKDHKGDFLVDGGILKNYPLQAFDFYDSNGTRYANPATLGFVSKDNKRGDNWDPKAKPIPVNNLFSYLKRVLDTAVTHEATTLSPNDKSRTVFIDCPSSVGILTFKVDDKQREELAHAAKAGLDAYIDKHYPKNVGLIKRRPLLYSHAPIKVLPSGQQFDCDKRKLQDPIAVSHHSP